MLPYHFTLAARADLRDIARYTRKTWGVKQARLYREELELSIQKLVLSPTVGRSREDVAPGVRSFPVAKHIAFYMESEDGIIVLRILHPRMDVEHAFSE